MRALQDVLAVRDQTVRNPFSRRPLSELCADGARDPRVLICFVDDVRVPCMPRPPVRTSSRAPAQPAAIPEGLKALAHLVLAIAASLDEPNCVPAAASAKAWSPHRLNAVLYTLRGAPGAPRDCLPLRISCDNCGLSGSLAPHVDNHEGLVVLFSIGCTSRFSVQLPGCDRQGTCGVRCAACDVRQRLLPGLRAHSNVVLGAEVALESGDALVFNGSAEARVLHGVEGILPGSCPARLRPMLERGRVGLQLRQRAGMVKI